MKRITGALENNFERGPFDSQAAIDPISRRGWSMCCSKQSPGTPAQRLETADELRLALERGDASGITAPRRAALAESNPLALWQGIAVISLLANLFLIYVLIAG